MMMLTWKKFSYPVTLKIISGRNDEKTTEYRKHKILRLLTKAAAVVVFISSVLFAATKMDANIFGFDAWKTTKTDKDSAGNFGITYDKNKKTKENGADKAKKRKKIFRIMCLKCIR